MKRRCKAVNEVLEGSSVTEVAARYGVTRETLHAWLRRYGIGGIGAGRPLLQARALSAPDAGEVLGVSAQAAQHRYGRSA